MEDIAIKVEAVYKDFRLPHEKNTTIKSTFVNLLRGKKSRTVSTQHALRDISFEIKKGEFFGIVGRNGSGKSTLLKILAGIYQPTKGTVQMSGRLVPFIELGVGFNPELTGRENVFLNGAMLGFDRKEIEAMYKDIVDFAELAEFMDQKLKNYSSGMQVRLAFSMAIRAEADVLLVDEVLAVGDADFQRKCFEYFNKLKKEKKTVVFVSHDMSAVREYCDGAILIEKSQIAARGSATKIANKYSQMFIDSASSTTKDELSAEKRWGSQGVYYKDIEVKVDKDYIYVEAKVSARESVKKVLYGVHIASADGKEVVATNNRMIFADDIKDISAGKDITIHWRILNIFNDGKFFVTVTLADPISTIFDWYHDAATFCVKRAERSTTPIMPPIETSYSVTQKVKK